MHLPSVGQWDWPGEPLTGTLAHALLDLEQPFCTTLDELLPKLLDETLTAEQLDDVLFGIREELRHVLYHVKDTKFFSHMLFDAEQPSRSAAASPIILRYPPVRVFANRLQREIGGPDV